MTDAWQAGTSYPPGSLVVPTSAPATASAAPTNSEFEAGNVGWTLGAGWVIANVGTAAFSGSWNATCTGAGTSEILNNNIVACVPGQSITANARIKATGNNASAGNVFIEWQDVGHARISVSAGNASAKADGQYEVSRVVDSAPSGTKYARIGAQAVVDGAGTVAVDTFTWTYVAPASASPMMYQATQAATATSGAAEPTWPTVLAGTVADGGVTWTAVTTNRVVWEAHAILTSGNSEPTWPTRPDAVTSDGTIQWKADARRVTDANCPNTRVVAKGASKIFAGDKDITRFSGTVNPIDWTLADDAGYLPTGMQQNSANDVRVLNIYRSNLAIFNGNGFQLWSIDPDPANMAFQDQLPIGSTWQKACCPVGNELVFLAAIGFRSIGIAIAAANLEAGDVGEPVDPIVQPAIAAAVASGIEPLAIYVPGAGQFWGSFPNYPNGSTTSFVLTLNGTQKKWSRYVHPFVIEAFTILGDDLYMRHGDLVSRHDITRNTDQIGAAEVIFPGMIQTAWLDLDNPGATKDLTGFEYVGDGQAPSLSVGTDQSNSGTFTAPFQLDTSDTVPGTPIPFAVAAPSMSFRMDFVGGAAWSMTQLRLYLNDQVGQP